jgi:hypothetical protein
MWGEFLLTDPVVFPNFEFARALKAELEGDGGTVFMWSPHENTILNKIVDQLKAAVAGEGYGVFDGVGGLEGACGSGSGLRAVVRRRRLLLRRMLLS